MAADITPQDFTAKSSDVLGAEEAALKAAHDRALAELNRIKETAYSKGSNLSPFDEYEMYEVTGIGRYVIMREGGWKPLVNIIGNDKDQRSIVANIDFSANIYPAFDGIIGEHFESPYLLDPMDDKFMSFKGLRDNLAAVRNFLLQTYYANPPEHMTSDKARESLRQIAGFVGDGLYNNWLFLGVLPTHDPRKPYIDLERASEGGGKGAQYIYDKILEMQRQSSWMRPFEAVKALFGGKTLHDWQLPNASETHFLDNGKLDINDPAVEHEAAVMNDLNAIEKRRAEIRDARTMSNVASDIDSLGNQLIYTAMNMKGVAQMGAAERRDAVDIAHDILRKLKVKLGGAELRDGLNMQPSDDMATLGGIKGVAMVYERLLAWARANNDAAIFQHPSVIAATRAIGQLGYQAKREALRYARMAKNGVLAEGFSEQLKRVPDAYRTKDGTFGALFETIESGINTVLNRTQQVSVGGAKVGHSVDEAMGTTLDKAPSAGAAKNDDAAQRNQMAQQATELANIATAQRIHNQLAANARQQQAQGQSAQQPQQAAPRGGTVGRQSLAAAQSARQQQSRSTSTSSSSAVNPAVAALSPAQQQFLARQASMANAAAARRREEQQRQEQQRLQQIAHQEASAQRAARRAAMKIDPAMLNGIRSATSLSGIPQGAEVVTGGRRISPADVRASMNKPQTVAPTATAKPPAPTISGASKPTKMAPAEPTKVVASGDKAPEDALNQQVLPTPTPPVRGTGRGY